MNAKTYKTPRNLLNKRKKGGKPTIREFKGEKQISRKVRGGERVSSVPFKQAAEDNGVSVHNGIVEFLETKQAAAKASSKKPETKTEEEGSVWALT